MENKYKCCGDLEECKSCEKNWVGEGLFVCEYFNSEDFTCEVKKK